MSYQLQTARRQDGKTARRLSVLGYGDGVPERCLPERSQLRQRRTRRCHPEELYRPETWVTDVQGHG